MKPGEDVRISSEGGHDYACRVLEVADTFVQLTILDDQIESTELANPVFLFQALPKGDRMEYVVQKAVELGVHEIIPVAMKYCVVKLDEKKAQAKVRRWQAIAQSAAKQSKRSRVPVVRPVMDFASAALYAMECDCRLVPYENECGMQAAAKALGSIRRGERISVMIGPEGGFDTKEVALAKEEGFCPVTLGKRILRTETAGMALLSILMYQLEK